MQTLTSEQQELCAQAARVCRLLWNLALEQRRDHDQRYAANIGKRLKYVAQARELTVLRREVDFIRDVSQHAQQYVLKAFEEAYVRMWKGQGGYPQPKRKGDHESFTVARRYVEVRKLNRKWVKIRMPGIGWLKTRYLRAHRGTMTEATESLTPLGWQIALSYKYDPNHRCVLSYNTFSDGAIVEVEGIVAFKEGSHGALKRGLGQRPFDMYF